MKKATLLVVCITALLFSCKDEPTNPYNYRDDIVGTYRGELIVDGKHIDAKRIVLTY
jgi:hypothetical protein